MSMLLRYLGAFLVITTSLALLAFSRGPGIEREAPRHRLVQDSTPPVVDSAQPPPAEVTDPVEDVPPERTSFHRRDEADLVLAEGQQYYTSGVQNGGYGTGLPIESNHSTVLRGSARYEMYCRVCHGDFDRAQQDRPGGNTAPALTVALCKSIPDGRLFALTTSEKNTLQPHGPQISVEDRWALVAFLKAGMDDGNPL